MVPVAPSVVAARRDARQFARTGYVVEYTGKPASTRAAFRQAAADAGLSRASPHVLKHGVVSWLAEDGVSVDRIADLTATNRATVLRICRKFGPE